MNDKASAASQSPARNRAPLLSLRGRLNRRRNDRQGQHSLAEELASALALVELTNGLDPGLRSRLIQGAARRLHPSGLELPSEDNH